jgi:DNA-binding CsgD family transcriptional regulator
MAKTQLDADNGASFLACRLPHEVLALVADDAGVRLAVVTPTGEFLYANDVLLERIRTTRHLDSVEGRHTRDVLSRDIAEAYLQAFAHVHRAQRPAILDIPIDGVRLRAVLRPTTWGDQPAVLVVSRDVQDMLPLDPPHIPGFDVIKPDVTDRGPLSQLTDRELQVLAMIGEGLSTEEIAKRIGRSTKTVEWHRASLGNKLGCSNRVELARVAIKAGIAQTSRFGLPTHQKPTDNGKRKRG